MTAPEIRTRVLRIVRDLEDEGVLVEYSAILIGATERHRITIALDASHEPDDEADAAERFREVAP